MKFTLVKKDNLNVSLEMEANEFIASIKENSSQIKELLTAITTSNVLETIGQMIDTAQENEREAREAIVVREHEARMELEKLKGEIKENEIKLNHANELELEKLRKQKSKEA